MLHYKQITSGISDIQKIDITGKIDKKGKHLFFLSFTHLHKPCILFNTQCFCTRSLLIIAALIVGLYSPSASQCCLFAFALLLLVITQWPTVIRSGTTIWLLPMLNFDPVQTECYESNPSQSAMTVLPTLNFDPVQTERYESNPLQSAMTVLPTCSIDSTGIHSTTP